VSAPPVKVVADAAGLPILPGLVRYDEVQAGEIAHAIRFTAARTRGRPRMARPPQRFIADRQSIPSDRAAFPAESGL